MANSFWDSEEEVAQIEKGKGGLYKVSLCRKGASYFVNLREFWLDSKLGELKPGKNGAAIPFELAEGVGRALLAAVLVRKG